MITAWGCGETARPLTEPTPGWIASERTGRGYCMKVALEEKEDVVEQQFTVG